MIPLQTIQLAAVRACSVLNGTGARLRNQLGALLSTLGDNMVEGNEFVISAETLDQAPVVSPVRKRKVAAFVAYIGAGYAVRLCFGDQRGL